MIDDAELLCRYAEEKSEAAFAELVRRHLDLVYSTALRQLAGDTHLAQDVAQTVFTDLARKASSLAGHAALTGWLYLGAHHAAAQAVRGEQRRRVRESEASTMHELFSTSAPTTDWDRVRPVLDDAMRELTEPDREAVLLRYFEKRPFADIGAALRVTEDAARMRVERALDRLHGLLAKRGVTSTAAALTAVLANQAIASAPAGLAATVTSAALVGASAGGGGALAAAKVFTFMSTTKIMVGVAGVIAVAATAISWQQQQANAELRREITALRQQQTSTVAALRADNERLVAEKKSEEDTASVEHLELVQLREAREAFRQRQTAANRAMAASSDGDPAKTATLAPGMITVDTMQNVGRDTPRAAGQTQVWAWQHGDVKTAAAVITFGPAERAKLEAFIATLPEKFRADYGTPEELFGFFLAGNPRQIAGVQMLNERQVSADEVVQLVQTQLKTGETARGEITFVRDAEGWKQVVSPKTVDAVIAYFRGKQ